MSRGPVSGPRKLVRFPFGGTVGAIKAVIGMTGDSDADLTIPGTTTSMIPVFWGIWNLHSTNVLYFQFGPHTNVFTAAAAAVLDNYATLLPSGMGYEENYKEVYQQGDLLQGSVQDERKQLLVLSNLAGCTFSGVCWAWVPE